MADADEEADAWREATLCDTGEGTTEVGGLEYQGLAAALKPPLYGMEAIMSGEAYEEGMMAGCAQEVDDADKNEDEQDEESADEDCLIQDDQLIFNPTS